MIVALKNIKDRKVLIINGEVDICLLMKAYYLRKNCPVRIAHSLNDALVTLAEEAQKVILLDSGISSDLKGTGDQILKAAPNARLIITGPHRANSYFDHAE